MYHNILMLIIFILLLFYFNLYNRCLIPNNDNFNPFINYYDLLEYIKIINKNNYNKLINYKKIIPINLKPRNDIPINNLYEIIKNKYDTSDYHFVIYWLNKNKGKLIIRRLDDYKITNPFKLKIYDSEYNYFDIFDFEPTNDNEIIKIINVDIDLVKVNIDYEQKIPKIIIQCGENNECNMVEYNAIMTFIELNPEYEYKYYNNKKNIIKQHILNNGGCYFDTKQINRVPLRKIINKNIDLIKCNNYDGLLCKSNDKVINKKLYLICKQNIFNYKEYIYSSELNKIIITLIHKK